MFTSPLTMSCLSWRWCAECDQRVQSSKESSGILISPGYPDGYAANKVCRYYIDGLVDKDHLEKVTLTFEVFDIPVSTSLWVLLFNCLFHFNLMVSLAVAKAIIIHRVTQSFLDLICIRTLALIVVNHFQLQYCLSRSVVCHNISSPWRCFIG